MVSKSRALQGCLLEQSMSRPKHLIGWIRKSSTGFLAATNFVLSAQIYHIVQKDNRDPPPLEGRVVSFIYNIVIRGSFWLVNVEYTE